MEKGNKSNHMHGLYSGKFILHVIVVGFLACVFSMRRPSSAPSNKLCVVLQTFVNEPKQQKISPFAI